MALELVVLASSKLHLTKNFIQKVNHLGNEEVLTPQQVTVAMLSHLKAIAETALKTKVTDCVISVRILP